MLKLKQRVKLSEQLPAVFTGRFWPGRLLLKEWLGQAHARHVHPLKGGHQQRRSTGTNL